MQKIVTPEQMVELEKKTYRWGYSEEEYMEKAGQEIAEVVAEFISLEGPFACIWLLCGKGNNGGDAFVAGRYLLEKGYCVKALQFANEAECSVLAQKNRARFLEVKGQIVSQLPDFTHKVIFLDGLFGTGFKGTIQEPYFSLIEAVNQTKYPILAIDIPSGLDGCSGEIQGVAIRATQTLYLGLPKLGFFLKQGWNSVGQLIHIDFGLPKKSSDNLTSECELLTASSVAEILPPIIRSRHKYQVGHTIGVAGSKEFPGAAYLSLLAAMRGGSGIVRYASIDNHHSSLDIPEVTYLFYDQLTKLKDILQTANAVFIGPGIGRKVDVGDWLQEVVPLLEKPCVIDADALYFFAKHPFALPKEVIFTPHLGEMKTLLQASEKLEVTLNLLHTCQKYATDKKITLILKGAPSFIFHPSAPIYVNPTGTPAMATAGSGDVLTGLITALLSQGLPCLKAAMLGVYLHGLAGECAVKQRGTCRGLLARDIIEHFASAYQLLEL